MVLREGPPPFADLCGGRSKCPLRCTSRELGPFGPALGHGLVPGKCITPGRSLQALEFVPAVQNPRLEKRWQPRGVS